MLFDLEAVSRSRVSGLQPYTAYATKSANPLCCLARTRPISLQLVKSNFCLRGTRVANFKLK